MWSIATRQVVLALILLMSPFHVDTGGPFPYLGLDSAYAGKGNGNSGNGNSCNGNSGRGNSQGNSGDNSGKGKSNNANAQAKGYANSATGDRIEVSGNNITVVHANGLSERIMRNRYEMKDARQRTIIERQATASDRTRLFAMMN